MTDARAAWAVAGSVQRLPAELGWALADVDTPALVVDLAPFERNLGRMAGDAKRLGVALRPHAKTHKCPEIAKRQIALGAVGQCCQKVGEAEAMVAGGVGDVLVSNEVVGAGKLARLARLGAAARIGVCVDDAAHVAPLGAAARAAGTRIRTLVELDVGAARCGVGSGQQVVALARLVEDEEGLSFGGLQAYHGRAQHLRTPAERAVAIDVAAEKVRAAVAALAGAGIAVACVTGAGTGTYALEAASGAWTELQCGSYAFMDLDYRKNRDTDGAPALEFEHSLFVQATVISRPAPDRCVVDAGLKSLAFDSGMPAVWQRPDLVYHRASDEHGVIRIDQPARAPNVGDKLLLVPGHCDPTINFYDWYVAVREGRVEALWPIAARGAIL